MTGRGIDQILPFPSNPSLHEPFIASAIDYVKLAEATNGSFSHPVKFNYIWGDLLGQVKALNPLLRIINLETAVTTSDAWLYKGINYRMHPKNLPCLSAASIDCCVLANNHVLDWGQMGLLETLDVLHQAGLKTCGAGQTLAASQTPAIFKISAAARILVFSFGMDSSGIPNSWAATDHQSGVSFLKNFSEETVMQLAEHIKKIKRPGDIVIVSLHWGPNWGYEVHADEQKFARDLIDEAGVDILHGHSSHHPKGIEVYQGKLILYGCGDLINDYEGIGGYEFYRSNLVMAYLPTLDIQSGNLISLQLLPFLIQHFRLNTPDPTDILWIIDRFNRESRQFGTRLEKIQSKVNGSTQLFLVWH